MLEGYWLKPINTTSQLHQMPNLLAPLNVVNPYAKQLTFLSDKPVHDVTMKYLTLIRTIALPHQYQRDIKHIEHHGSPCYISKRR